MGVGMKSDDLRDLQVLFTLDLEDGRTDPPDGWGL
jgi:hypothetical protein